MPEKQRELKTALAQREVPSLAQKVEISSEFLRHLEEEPSILNLRIHHLLEVVVVVALMSFLLEMSWLIYVLRIENGSLRLETQSFLFLFLWKVPLVLLLLVLLGPWESLEPLGPLQPLEPLQVEVFPSSGTFFRNTSLAPVP